MLTLRNVVAGHPGCTGLQGLSLAVEDQSITAVVGPSGCGKTSLSESICGLLHMRAGLVLFDSVDITRASVRQRVGLGIGYVPARRTLFPQMSLQDNLRLGHGSPGCGGAHLQWARILSLFPELRFWLPKPAGSLTSGLHRIAMFARALMRLPRLLVLDEPWFGIAGDEIELLSQVIIRMRNEQLNSVLITGQAVFHTLNLADTVCRMDAGRITREQSGLEFLADRSAHAEFAPGPSAP